jgi:hypothetical protein
MLAARAHGTSSARFGRGEAGRPPGFVQGRSLLLRSRSPGDGRSYLLARGPGNRRQRLRVAAKRPKISPGDTLHPPARPAAGSPHDRRASTRHACRPLRSRYGRPLASRFARVRRAMVVRASLLAVSAIETAWLRKAEKRPKKRPGTSTRQPGVHVVRLVARFSLRSRAPGDGRSDLLSCGLGGPIHPHRSRTAAKRPAKPQGASLTRQPGLLLVRLVLAARAHGKSASTRLVCRSLRSWFAN